MRPDSNVEALVGEYESVFSELNIRDNEPRLRHLLQDECEWTQEGAETVLHLAKTYGTFVLRNALAVAISLDIEDGSSGL
jgi:hypothetical protein